MVDVDLGRDRHAVQRRQGMAARAGGVGRLGGGARLGLQHAHDGVDRRIDLVQAAEDGVDGLPRRGLAGADEARQVGRVVLPKLHLAVARVLRDFHAEEDHVAVEIGHMRKSRRP